MFSYFAENSEEFVHLVDLIVHFAAGGNLNEKKKISKVFIESLIEVLIG